MNTTVTQDFANGAATGAAAGAASTVYIIIALVMYVLLVIANWKIFTKAGEAGWKSLIPFYSTYIYVKLVDGNGWKFLLLLIPIVNIVYFIILDIKTAKAFGKGTGFTIGLIFLANIFTLILGFGSAEYIGPNGVPADAAPVPPVQQPPVQ